MNNIVIVLFVGILLVAAGAWFMAASPQTDPGAELPAQAIATMPELPTPAVDCQWSVLPETRS